MHLNESNRRKLTNNYHTHTPPGVRYYQYDNDVPVSAPAKSFM